MVHHPYSSGPLAFKIYAGVGRSWVYFNVPTIPISITYFNLYMFEQNLLSGALTVSSQVVTCWY